MRTAVFRRHALLPKHGDRAPATLDFAADQRLAPETVVQNAEVLEVDAPGTFLLVRVPPWVIDTLASVGADREAMAACRRQPRRS